MTGLTAWRRAGAHLVPGLVALGTVVPVDAEPVRAKPGWTSGTFVYADLCTRSGSGARLGQRVTLRRSPNGDGLTYEGSDGAGPVAAGSMTLDGATKAIAFAVETEAGPLRFQGVAASDALTGTFADEAGIHAVNLPRVLRSHAREACPDETTGSIGRGR